MFKFAPHIFLILLFCSACTTTPRQVPDPELAYYTSEPRLDSATYDNNQHHSRAKLSEDYLDLERNYDQIPREDLTFSAIGSRWFYGQGFGASLLNIGTTILFPPYGLYLVGNAGLEVAGLQTFYATDALPQKPRSFVLEFYDGITSIPGRLAALIAGKTYHEKRLKPSDAFKVVRGYAEADYRPAPSQTSY